MPGVLLSYRRSDSPASCKRLADHLSLRSGDDIVLREVDAALRGSEVVLVLIGPQWFATGQRRRLADPKDVLRGEIAAALRSPRRKGGAVAVGLRGAAGR